MVEELTDGQLAGVVDRVLAGDRESYARVVDACQDRVRAFAAGFCRSGEEVEEVCHLVFVEAYRRLESFDPERGPLVGWLLTIARSCLLGELRRRKAEGERAARYLERAAATRVDRARLEAERVALEKCLAELDSEEARLVDRRYRGGLSSRQLAEALGRTAGAVRMELQRIRERLRGCIGRRLADEEA